MSTVLPRRFALIRHIDYTGVSGIGVVAYGVAFADGQVVLRWCSSHPATSMWTSIEDMLAVHGHGEATSVEWIDAPHGDLEEISPSQSGRRARRRAARERVRAPRQPDEPAETSVPARSATPDTSGLGVQRTEPDAARRADDSATAASERPASAPRATDQESTANRAGARPPESRPPFAGRPVRLIDLSRDEEEDREARNGHLDIDTAPLLHDSTASEGRSPDGPHNEPAPSRPAGPRSAGQSPRRGGRHRRPDPPERPR
ncbi:MAG TPA: hypothetical protein VK925_12170 [Jiangellaceae bacterium]|nr:hypothetical protein [Jiangellaceae bacterium]